MYRALIMLQTSCYSSFNFFTHTRLSKKKTQNIAAPIVHKKSLLFEPTWSYFTWLSFLLWLIFFSCVVFWAKSLHRQENKLSLNGRSSIDKSMRQSINESPGGQRCLPTEGHGLLACVHRGAKVQRGVHKAKQLLCATRSFLFPLCVNESACLPAWLLSAAI